ncbi:hypothetical protein ACJIZ3_004824 [Penstemon smallii]|uniref:Epidermal patterning factor-like protein n=1 Tax=Penstemon smallii TaxID=265156 RepID=A0ABD3S334_9LAMI
MKTNYSLIALISILSITLFPLSNSFKPPDSFRGLMVEEKTRLGSTPPSCHNKCNQCHPCMAVQVPTLPSHNRVDPSSTRSKQTEDYFDSSGNRYSNYKPLGWKCRCGGHFYNP